MVSIPYMHNDIVNRVLISIQDISHDLSVFEIPQLSGHLPLTMLQHLDLDGLTSPKTFPIVYILHRFPKQPFPYYLTRVPILCLSFETLVALHARLQPAHSWPTARTKARRPKESQKQRLRRRKLPEIC